MRCCLIGSSGSMIVELNGEVVHTFNDYAGRPYAPTATASGSA